MLLAAGGTRAQNTSAQDRHAQGDHPFSRLALYTGGSAEIGSNRLGDYYPPSLGLDVAASMPFYAGTLGLGLGLRRHEAYPGRRAQDFWALPLTLHWGVRPRLVPSLAPGLRVEASARLGALLMHFRSRAPGLQNESELLMGLDLGLSLPLFGRWRLALGTRYEHTFTAPAMQLWHVRAGLRRSFRAPRWLQTLLR